MNSHHIHFASKRESDGKYLRYSGDDNYDIPKSMKSYLLLRAGWLKRLDKNKFPEDSFAWFDHPETITDEGRKIANEYRHELVAYDKKQEEERAKIERLVISKNCNAWGEQKRFAALCRVIKETPKRLYVELVKQESRYGDPIRGSRNNRFIERDDVMVDNATEEMFDRLMKLESEQKEWNKSLNDQLQAELEPIRKRYEQRAKQGEARFEDEIKEVIESEIS